MVVSIFSLLMDPLIDMIGAPPSQLEINSYLGTEQAFVGERFIRERRPLECFK